MRETLQEYCIRMERQDLLKEWDYEKNGEVTPADISYGAKKRMWWRCSHNHSWSAFVYSRTGDQSGCPYCARKLPLPGKTDLQSEYPVLAKEWHPTKNGTFTPEQVLSGSKRIIWWKCEKGHEWTAQIRQRAAGTNCPICSNHTLLSGANDLATKYPELALQWCRAKNGTLSPEKTRTSSDKKVWWTCEKGHAWQASVESRVRGTGCPVCANRTIIPGENDLATLYPSLVPEWHQEKNALTPEEVSLNSNRRVWWKCSLGHEWQAVIAHRTAGVSGCPYCAGRRVLTGFNDLATKEPLLAKQWHSELNGLLTPTDVSPGSHKAVWWQCSEGHVWKAVVYSRAGKDKCGCPVCSGKLRKSRQQAYEQMTHSATK